MNQGKDAEEFAAQYLRMLGYTVLTCNWKTFWCEIDIVAQRRSVIHIIEVKYRKNNKQGEALEYITSQKKQQLRLAASNWVMENKWEGDYQIDAIGITGSIKLDNLKFVSQAVEIDR